MSSSKKTAAVAKGVPFAISDPEKIPAKRYYDEDFYKLENEKLWMHAWQMACRLEQIQNVGDWIEYKILDKSVIIVRAKSGVKAFHNACRHRGVPVAEGTHGNCETKGFICPFHGWRYNLEGKNTFVYGKHMFSEDVLDQAELALVPCRLEEWGGCVFINFDNDAKSLRENLGPLAENLDAHGIADLKAEWCFGTVLPANWKTAMEAFMEGYHVMRTHPQLQEAAPALYNSMYATLNPTEGYETGGQGVPINPNMTVKENVRAQFENVRLVGEGMAGMVQPKELEIARELLEMPLPDDPQQAVMYWFGAVQDQITKRLQARGEPVPDLNAVAVSHPIKAVEFMFPNYFLLPMFSSMSAYRIRPLGPESCFFELWSLTFYPKGEEPAPVMEPTILPYDSQEFPPIPRQDYSNIPIQQRGLHAAGFEYMRLSRDIEGMISNYNRLIDGYLADVSKDKLAKANHALSGNFDGKIAELDL